MKQDYTHEFTCNSQMKKYGYFTVRANSMEHAKEKQNGFRLL